MDNNNEPPPPYYEPPPPYSQNAFTGTGRSQRHRIRRRPVNIGVGSVGPQPVIMICPHCHANVESTMKKNPSTKALILGLIMAVIFPFNLGCCFVPCCLDECMDVEHSCPNCQAYLGNFRR